jgi:hypothetical protein
MRHAWIKASPVLERLDLSERKSDLPRNEVFRKSGNNDPSITHYRLGRSGGKQSESIGAEINAMSAWQAYTQSHANRAWCNRWLLVCLSGCIVFGEAMGVDLQSGPLS